MKKALKIAFEWIDEYFGLFAAIIMVCAVSWFVYKISAGLYHLIEKLIDKL